MKILWPVVEARSMHAPGVDSQHSLNSSHKARVWTNQNIISSWKILLTPQINRNALSGAKLLEGYSGVSKIEQPCYNAC